MHRKVRRIVDRGDGDRDRGGLGDGAGGDGVGEAVRTGEVAVRGVADRAGGGVDDRDRTVGALGHGGEGRRAGEGVVGQHVDGCRCFLGRGDRVVDGGVHRYAAVIVDDSAGCCCRAQNGPVGGVAQGDGEGFVALHGIILGSLNGEGLAGLALGEDQGGGG